MQSEPDTKTINDDQYDVLNRIALNFLFEEAGRPSSSIPIWSPRLSGTRAASPRPAKLKRSTSVIAVVVVVPTHAPCYRTCALQFTVIDAFDVFSHRLVNDDRKICRHT
jgi:hypothetical protein